VFNGDTAVQLVLLAPWALGVALLLLALRRSFSTWVRVMLWIGTGLAFGLASLMAYAAVASF
jgi:hypothetical protein